MGIFDVFQDIITAPIMLPIKAANTVISLPGQIVKDVSSATVGVAGVAGKVASSGISASVRSIETISTAPFKTAQNVAGIAGATVQGSVASVAGAAESVGSSLAMPLAVAGGAVLLVMLLRER
jgi:hypothetical protein